MVSVTERGRPSARQPSPVLFAGRRQPAVHGSDLLSRDPSCHSSSAAAGWTGESGQSHSGTTATASAFSKLQLAGTETVGSSSGTCSTSSEACASSAQADTGLAVQYPGATTSSAVLSERQPGSVNTDLGFLQPEEAAPVKSFSPGLPATQKGVPTLSVRQASAQVGQLVIATKRAAAPSAQQSSGQAAVLSEQAPPGPGSAFLGPDSYPASQRRLVAPIDFLCAVLAA